MALPLGIKEINRTLQEPITVITSVPFSVNGTLQTRGDDGDRRSLEVQMFLKDGALSRYSIDRLSDVKRTGS